ncbi:MAG: YciI family protein [Candidatus Binatia bacterium]
MKFLLMILTDEKAEGELSPGARDEIVARHGAVTRELRAAGALVGAGRLSFSNEATTIRRRGDAYVTVDGPFAETREVFGGFYLIDAASRAEAIAWAQKLPLREGGAIEIRPARTGATWRGKVLAAKRFLVAFIADTTRPQSRDQVFRAIDAHYELSLDLAARGMFVASRALEPAATGTTLRWRDGAHVVTDGPFAESKEFVAGYFVIACDSKDEAIAWAKPLMAGSAACEVRPVWE